MPTAAHRVMYLQQPRTATRSSEGAVGARGAACRGTGGRQTGRPALGGKGRAGSRVEHGAALTWGVADLCLKINALECTRPHGRAGGDQGNGEGRRRKEGRGWRPAGRGSGAAGRAPGSRKLTRERAGGPGACRSPAARGQQGGAAGLSCGWVGGAGAWGYIQAGRARGRGAARGRGPPLQAAPPAATLRRRARAGVGRGSGGRGAARSRRKH
jgi:hypothetical protein